MEFSASPANLVLLRSLTPFDAMKRENLLAVAKKVTRKQAPAGRVLFREEDTERQTYYLLVGNVDLLKEGEIMASVQGGSAQAKNPLAHAIPRPYSAVAATPIEYLLIDSEFLDVMVTFDQTGAYHVSELHSVDSALGEEAVQSDDWMTTLLQAKAFHKVPPANIQAIFMRLQRVDFRAGDVVIKQGAVGDFFYVVVKGKCAVTRETPLNKEGTRLAELKMGDTFGEEALISDAKRNATVTMLADGYLMRLGKQDFRSLLNEPLLEWVDYPTARRMAAAGAGGRWLDVRLPSEFDQYHAPEALNIPLYALRLKIKSLDPNTHYVVCCDTGRRSSAGAYILSERGFHASVLRGGLMSTEIARKQ